MTNIAVKFKNLNLNNLVLPRTDHKGLAACNELLLVDSFT